MRLVLLSIMLVAACGGTRAPRAPSSPPITPADDLAVARSNAPKADPSDTGLVAKDPRVVDLDIIRIRASSSGVGGDPELTSVASADVFRKANESAKAGTPIDAIARYRQLIAEFPDSLYAPVALFNVAALQDAQGDPAATIATLRELVVKYPTSRESIEGHLYIAAIQADKKQWTDAVATLDQALGRTSLTYADRVEAFARKGYVQLELGQLDAADATLQSALGEWRKAPRLDDVYYIAMAHYYRGEVSHRKLAAHKLRSGDDEMVADLEAKRVLAVQAYDRWKDSLQFRHAYWATASGYQMSQIFAELWEAHVKAPYPRRIEVATRPKYVVEVHDRVREHLTKALEGHRMNVELAAAFGVDTEWSEASKVRAAQIMELLAREANGTYVTPAN